MKINDVYNRLKNGEEIKYEEKEISKFYCPKCKKFLLGFELKEGNVECKTSQKTIYYDGDTININEKYYPRVDAMLCLGICENCGQQLALINLIILDKDIDNDSLEDDMKDVFCIFSEDDIIKQFKEVRHYGIYFDNIQIGKAFTYKKAIINKECVHGLTEDIERNITLLSLECLAENEDMKILDIGICNGHYERESQYNVWEKVSFIAEKVINSVTDIL